MKSRSGLEQTVVIYEGFIYIYENKMGKVEDKLSFKKTDSLSCQWWSDFYQWFLCTSMEFLRTVKFAPDNKS